MFRKTYSDAELVEMILLGARNEDLAVRQILSRNRKPITRMVLGRGGDSENAEDVLLDGVVELIFLIQNGRFIQGNAINSLLWGICRNIWNGKLRIQAREHLKVQKLPVVDDYEDQTPEVVVFDEELKIILNQLSIYLGEDCFKVLLLDASGFRPAEIMAKMPQFGSAQAVMNKKYKCKEKLSKEIESNEDFRKYLKALESFYFTDK